MTDTTSVKISDIDKKSAHFNRLVKWLLDNGSLINEHLEIRPDANGVFGVYTKEFIPKGTVVARILNSSMIDEKMYPTPKDWDSKTKHTYCILRESRNANTKLPLVVEGMPSLVELGEYHPFLAMSKQESIEIEELSPLFRMFRENAEGAFNNVYNLIHKHDSSIDKEMVLSAYMLYVTRTWPGLYIPYLDMFNHSVQFGSVIQSDKHYQQIQTMVDYLPGEQVYVSYGIKDVLTLAYDYGFHDPSDYAIAIPFRLAYTAKNPLQFAVAKMLMNRGMTSVFDDNMDLRVFFKSTDVSTQYDHFIGFSDHGISIDTFEIFSLMAIENYKELEEKKGSMKNTLLLIKEHIQIMIESSATGPVEIKPNYSSAYNTLIKALKKRIEILNNCLIWINTQLKEKSVGPI